VACIGNSITDGHGIDMATRHGYPAQLQQLLGSGYDVRNYGVSSRTLLNKGDHPFMKEQAWRDALAFRPDIVVIKLGTNDSKPENWQYGTDFENDLLTMVNALKESCKSSKPQIYLCTPIPAFKSTWNISDSVISQSIIPVIRRVAKKQKLQLIDLHSSFTQEELMLPDGIHPNDKGARRLAELVAEAIKAAQ
jgi:lysophospholipase L1-like esterase